MKNRRPLSPSGSVCLLPKLITTQRFAIGLSSSNSRRSLLSVNRIVFCVHNNYRLSINCIFTRHIECQNRTCQSARCTVMCSQECHVNSKAIVLFARTSHISSSGSCNSIVITYRIVEICTNRHVQQRQSSNTPLMAVTGNSSKQAVTLEASQHSKRAGVYSITLSILTSGSCDVVCQVNNLSAEFILLVYIIVKAV